MAAGGLKVFISHRDSTCDECGEPLGRGAWILLAGERGAVCLTCADLDHLAYLPSGDTALTRRSRTRSTLSAVVLRWSRARKRYERQGVLVEEEALDRAEQECRADHAQRKLRMARAAVRRAEIDREYVEQFGRRIRELFPGCPAGRETVIAEHACRKYSGRVGRSATAKRFDEEAVRMAVTAHVRHAETRYDELLAGGYERSDARREVRASVEKTLMRWAAVP